MAILHGFNIYVYVCIHMYLVTQTYISVNILSAAFPCQVKPKVENGKCLHLRQYPFHGFGIIQLIFLQRSLSNIAVYPI